MEEEQVNQEIYDNEGDELQKNEDFQDQIDEAGHSSEEEEGEDQIALKKKPVKRERTQKQIEAFEKCRKARMEKLASEKKARAKAIKGKKINITEEINGNLPTTKGKKTKRCSKPKPKPKQRKQKIVYEDYTSSEEEEPPSSSDEEDVIVVRRRKPKKQKPKRVAKKQPQVIYEDDLLEDEDVPHNIEIPRQPQLYIV